MKRRKIISEYMSRIREVAFASCDGEYQLRCKDAENVFISLLDDLLYQEYLNNECRRYDFWDEEIKHDNNF